MSSVHRKRFWSPLKMSVGLSVFLTLFQQTCFEVWMKIASFSRDRADTYLAWEFVGYSKTEQDRKNLETRQDRLLTLILCP